MNKNLFYTAQIKRKIQICSCAVEISVMLYVATSHWVTALEDHHAKLKSRIPVTQRCIGPFPFPPQTRPKYSNDSVCQRGYSSLAQLG